MQKFLSSSGAMLVLDETTQKISLARYHNDIIGPSKTIIVEHATPLMIDRLISAGSMRPL